MLNKLIEPKIKELQDAVNPYRIQKPTDTQKMY